MPPPAHADPQCPPPWEWQRGFGGTNYNQLHALAPTRDGGLVAAGLSNSGATGNKTCAGFGLADGWLVRLDASGSKLWEVCLGGIETEGLDSVDQTSDGGFVVAGISSSPPSGNKTARLEAPNGDFWVVRLDADGRILWDRSLGGYPPGGQIRVHGTSDGGVIAGVASSVPTGFFKTAQAWGKLDYWLVRLDASGHKLWEVSFGGNGDDLLGDVRQTEDGGFLAVGQSYSGISGNKTTPVGGRSDGWVVRTDANGKKLWEKTYGVFGLQGFTCMAATSDGGFILGGDNVATGAVAGAQGGHDYWVVRIDRDGNQLWERFYGTGGDEYLRSVSALPDGGFILGGEMNLPPLPVDSGNSVSLMVGQARGFWLVRTDSTGNKLWDVIYGDDDEKGSLGGVVTTTDGRIAFGAMSYSAFPVAPHAGLTGNRAVRDIGGQDYWVVKLGPETFVDGIQVCASTVVPQSVIPAQQGVRFRAAGPTNLVYTLESSTNLIHWTQFGTNMNGNRLLEVLDPSYTNSAHRFYRARAASPQ